MQASERPGKRLDREQARSAAAIRRERSPGGLNAEVLRFLLVGGAAALMDLALYLLLKLAGLPVPLAKGASFVMSSAAAYFGNKHYTYRREAKGPSSVLLYGLLYACTLALNVLVNDSLLAALRLPATYEIGLAWAVATAASASVNFLGTKLVIFRGDRLP